MNFNEVKNIVGEGKKVPFLLRKATNSLIFFWHIDFNPLLCHCNFTKFLTLFRRQLTQTTTFTVQMSNSCVKWDWAPQHDHFLSLGSWTPCRSPGKAEDMSTVTMDSFNTPAHALWGVKWLPLQILWVAKWSTSISYSLKDDMWQLGPLMGFSCCPFCCTNSQWLTEQNECANPNPLRARELWVSISSLQSLWLWLFLLTAHRMIQ